MSYTYFDEGEIDQNPMFSQYFRGTERMKLPQRQTDSILEGFIITGRNSINPKIRRLALRPGSLAVMSTKKSRVVKEYFLSEIIDVRQSSRRCFQITVRTEKDSRLSRSRRERLVVKRKVLETPGPQSTAKWVQALRQACGKAAESQHLDPYAVNGLPINNDDIPEDEEDDDDDDDDDHKQRQQQHAKRGTRARSLSDPPTPRTARRQAAAEEGNTKKKEQKDAADGRRKSQLRSSASNKKDDAEKTKEKPVEDDKTSRRRTDNHSNNHSSSAKKAETRDATVATTRQRRSKTISSSRPSPGNKLSISMPEIPQVDLLSPAPMSGSGGGNGNGAQYGNQQQQQQQQFFHRPQSQQIASPFDPFGGGGGVQSAMPQRHSQHYQTWTGPPPAFLSTDPAAQLPSSVSAGNNSISNGGGMHAHQLFDQQRAQFEQQRKQLDDEIRTHQQKLAELDHYKPSSSGPKFILSTLGRQEGTKTDKEFGVVSGCGTVAAPKSKEEVQHQIELARSNAESELTKQAKLLGANALFSVGYTTSLHAWGVTVMAYGTACSVSAL